MTDIKVNSQEYWDKRFREDWEANLGREQSRYFARLAFDNFPGWLTNEAQMNVNSICDWGCAEGDGTDYLAGLLKSASITGVDFSFEAIETAKANYPNIKFLVEDWLGNSEPHEEYDIIFSSNTLEHFHEPRNVLEKLLNAARKCAVILIPYNEFHRHKEHHATFTDKDINYTYLGDYVLAHAQVIDSGAVDPRFWPGLQVLLVYAKLEFLREIDVSLADIEIGDEDELYQRELLEKKEQEVSVLSGDVTKLVRELEHVNNEVGLLRTELSQIHTSRSWRFVNRIHLLRKRMLPHGSLRYSFARGFYKCTSSIYHFKDSSLFRSLKSKWISARSKLIPAARFVYHKLPLPYTFKRRLVSLAFRYCGPLFTGQAQYVDWAKKQLDAHEWTGLQDIGPAMESHDVFVLSIINWDFRIQRPQHFARGLAKTHRVFYVEVDMNSTDFRMRKIDENLYVINFPIAGGKEVQPYTGLFEPDQIRDWLNAMTYFCNFADATSFKSIIVEHPQWWPLACHLSPDFRIVFDCMDDISGFSNTTSELLALEEDMLQNCDELIVSSQYLFDKYSKFKSPVLIRNGGEITHFEVLESERPLPKFLEDKAFPQSSERIRAGYVGAIAEWFDADLIAKTAQENPDIEFHLCGSVTASAPGRLAVFDNVILYGEIAYADVPAFIERMDVLLIPFQLLPIIQACDPVKFYEYSAMGKPTVTTRLPELARAEKLAFFASDSKEFAAQIHVAVEKGKDPTFRAALRAYAKENTWMHRVEQIEKALLDLPKVSVVILSYGDPKWTAATLESLHEKGGNYPNLEVIVVDNGSQPDWLAEIRLQAMRYPDVTVIENGANLGFAKGNNVGIGAATGDYVFLLNNDTYVAPGSIYAMVRHLERNQEIGIVGPLTNNIGNEAKVFVNYVSMAEMRSAASYITMGYRGVFTSLPVLAYFAVMFRKSDLDNIFGYISEDYGRGMFEDDDHCALIRSKGYICALAEDAFVHHHLSGTFNTVLPKEKQALFDANKKVFEAKWGDWRPHRHRSSRPRSAIAAKE